jgi:hypothetical protein
MSHILKKNKQLVFYIKLFISLFVFFIFTKTLLVYKGNLLIYILFSLVSNYLIWFSFRKKFSFFETFFCLFLWLGFWFKFSVILSFRDQVFSEGLVGLFNYAPAQFDSALIVSTVGIAGTIFAGHLREFFFSYPALNIKNFNKSLFYIKYKNFIIITFLALVILISFVNFYLRIYQKGLAPLEHYNFFFSGFIKIFLLFGLTSLSSFILYFEIISFKKLSFITFFIVVIETLLSSVSMISRAMIFSIGALYFAMYKFTKKIKEHFNIIFFSKTLLLIICLFYVSVVSSNYLRMIYFYTYTDMLLKENNLNTSQTNKKNIFENEFQDKNIFIIPRQDFTIILDKQDLKNTISLDHFLSLTTYRWVGIEGVMSVVGRSDILSFELIKKSFLDRFDINSSEQFYEKTFNLFSTVVSHNIVGTHNVKGNILPGMIAFLYYSGSLLFLFLLIVTLCLVASTVEFISFMISKKNMFFSSLVSMIIAYRFIHFGYLPHQSYLLFVSLFFVIFLVFLLFYISKKLQKN